VPVLMVDGSDATPNTPKDSYYLTTVFNVARGYQAVVKLPRDLDTIDLDQFPCVYLLNVPQFSEKTIKKLEDYVDRGGRVAIFLGDKVRATHYNEQLYKNGKGIFPVLLANRPTEKMDDDALQVRLFEDQYQIYVRDDQHPVFREIAKPNYRESLKF